MSSSMGRLMLSLAVLTGIGCDRDIAEQPLADVTAPSVAEQHVKRNPVLHWNRVAGESFLEIGPVIDSWVFAILHAAIHDAVNGVERRYEPYTADLSSRGASLDAAVATAARDVLVALAPNTRERIEKEYRSALTAIPRGRARNKGVKLGRHAARANLKRRSGDGIPVGLWPPQSGPITEPVYVPTGEPGDYEFTPPFDAPPLGPIALFPGWGRLTAFAVDVTTYGLPGPDALTSEEYARDLNHLQSVGSLQSRTRTADQTEVAKFWFEPSPALNQMANRALENHQFDAWDAARTLALMYLTVADAGIVCFEAKYRFRFWRPYTAIRRADEDDNPRTMPDTAWLPLLWPSPDDPEPIFLIPPIPEYPSAAALISAAAAQVLIDILGDEQHIEVTSPYLPGVTRRFTSFTHVAEEVGMSRVYGGIHFVRAVKDGAELGRSIGRDVSRLLPAARRWEK